MYIGVGAGCLIIYLMSKGEDRKDFDDVLTIIGNCVILILVIVFSPVILTFRLLRFIFKNLCK
jgi:hypothetical protein